MIPRVLTIAGSDSSGGAGIQADLKTFQELEVYGMSVITAITAQNTLGVQHVSPIPISVIEAQLDAILEDITIQGIKTGMLYNAEVIDLVADKIKKIYDKSIPIVVDPVRIAKGGHDLLTKSALSTLCDKLLPLTTVFTPNITEAEEILDIKIQSKDDMKEAAINLLSFSAKAVFLKGGHLINENDSMVADLYLSKQEEKWFYKPYIDTRNTHGTGCSLASAITAMLAKGKSTIEAVEIAKDYVYYAIQNSFTIGQGHGPINHWAYKQIRE